MKNIKIVPYPNLRITEECFERDIKQNAKSVTPENKYEAEEKLDFGSPNMLITEFINGDKRVIRQGPVVSVGSNKYCSVFPNPVHLFYDSAITLFNNSEETKKKSFQNCAEKSNKKIGEINFLDIDADETHMCYDEFFKLRMNAIIMLSTSIEAFINHSIPNDYPNRENVERYGKFKEKLETHLPNSLRLTEFWKNKEYIFDEIIKLYDMRNDLIHLKTNSQDSFEAYFEVISKMLDYDIEKAILVVGQFMNQIKSGFISEKSTSE